MIKKIAAGTLLAVMISIVVVTITNKSNDSEGPNVVDVSGNTDVEGVAIQSPSNSGLEVGQQAPNFKLETLSGEMIQLSDLRGKKVFINFWATWCPPCKKEMPDMQKFYEKHSDEVEILAVNVTNQETGTKVVRDFIRNYDYTYPILLDKKGTVASKYLEVNIIPTTYFIGTDGTIQAERKAGPMSYEFMEEMLNKLD